MPYFIMLRDRQGVVGVWSTNHRVSATRWGLELSLTYPRCGVVVRQAPSFAAFKAHRGGRRLRRARRRAARLDPRSQVRSSPRRRPSLRRRLILPITWSRARSSGRAPHPPAYVEPSSPREEQDPRKPKARSEAKPSEDGWVRLRRTRDPRTASRRRAGSLATRRRVGPASPDPGPADRKPKARSVACDAKTGGSGFAGPGTRGPQAEGAQRRLRREDGWVRLRRTRDPRPQAEGAQRRLRREDGWVRLRRTRDPRTASRRRAARLATRRRVGPASPDPGPADRKPKARSEAKRREDGWVRLRRTRDPL
jgi:hypothetical protein